MINVDGCAKVSMSVMLSWLSKIVRAEDGGIASMVAAAKTTRQQKAIQRTRYFCDDI